ncbi:uncharacterized protein LOC121391774 [Gigantopelta aegis]|uniref:uncharacterized protein LOC121391774 n=1 Tax=Gigantopelta aegis TaxID=1735272 RepID=UPI001B88BD4B|nr:uncharacterized protein LOC121391774 [Gigantopelta aegis]
MASNMSSHTSSFKSNDKTTSFESSSVTSDTALQSCVSDGDKTGRVLEGSYYEGEDIHSKSLPVNRLQLDKNQNKFLQERKPAWDYVIQQLKSVVEGCEIYLDDHCLKCVHVENTDLAKLKNKLSEVIVEFKVDINPLKQVFSDTECEQILENNLAYKCGMFIMLSNEESNELCAIEQGLGDTGTCVVHLIKLDNQQIKLFENPEVKTFLITEMKTHEYDLMFDEKDPSVASVKVKDVEMLEKAKLYFVDLVVRHSVETKIFKPSYLSVDELIQLLKQTRRDGKLYVELNNDVITFISTKDIDESVCRIFNKIITDGVADDIQMSRDIYTNFRHDWEKNMIHDLLQEENPVIIEPFEKDDKYGLTLKGTKTGVQNVKSFVYKMVDSIQEKHSKLKPTNRPQKQLTGNKYVNENLHSLTYTELSCEHATGSLDFQGNLVTVELPVASTTQNCDNEVSRLDSNKKVSCGSHLSAATTKKTPEKTDHKTAKHTTASFVKESSSTSTVSQSGSGGARPKQPMQTRKGKTEEFPDKTVDQIEYEAIKNLIGNKLFQRFCTAEQMTDRVKICFIPGLPDSYNEFECMYQKIIGLVRYDIDLSPSDSEKARNVAQNISSEFKGVFFKCCHDRLVIIGDDRDVTDAAKNKANVLLGKSKPTRRVQRQYATIKDVSESSHSSNAEALSSSKYITGSLDFQGNLLTVKVYNTDITKLKVDVVVNAANGQLDHSGGVASYIAKAAGDDLVRESRDYIKKYGDISVTKLAVTNAGRMPCKKVFHAVGPRWNAYRDSEKKVCLEDLLKTILRCLCAARNLNMTSIAIPSISSAIYAVPKEYCAEMYVRAAKSFDQYVQGGSLKEVHFVDVNTEMVDLIQKTFKKDWNKPAEKGNVKKYEAIINNMLGKYSVPVTSSGKISDSSLKNMNKVNKFTNDPNENGNNKDPEFTTMPISESEFSASSEKLPDILISSGHITHANTDAIVCWQDVKVSGKFRVARDVAEAAGQEYNRALRSSMVNKVEYGHVFHTTGGGLKKLVIHAFVSEASSSEADLEEIVDFKKIVSKILNVADALELSSVGFPVLMTRKDASLKRFSKDIFEAILAFATENPSSSVKHFLIVDQDKGHVQMMQCNIDELKKVHSNSSSQAIKQRPRDDGHNSEPETCACCQHGSSVTSLTKCKHPQCQNCKPKAVKPVYGNMPKGTMKYDIWKSSVEGYPGCGTIVIKYSIGFGYQQKEHPRPGDWYMGTDKMAFLPNNAEGRTVYKMLKIAFERRLTFTFGKNENGLDGVVFDIPHKTKTAGGPQKNGYPDPKYLKEVREQLARKGITEEDLVGTDV